MVAVLEAVGASLRAGGEQVAVPTCAGRPDDHRGGRTDAEISPLVRGRPPGVDLGEGSVVEEFCLVGRHARRPAGTRAVDRPALDAAQPHRGLRRQRIGDRFQTGHHALVREANTIGDDVSIGSLSVVEHHVTIGDGVRIHSQYFVPEFTVLEEGAWIGPAGDDHQRARSRSARTCPRAAWSVSTSDGTPGSAPT